MMIMAFVTGATGIGALMYVGCLITLGYYLFKDALLGGQSIGKKAMKYAAVREDGSSLDGDFMASATRNVSLLIPFVGLYEIFLILTSLSTSSTLAQVCRAGLKPGVLVSYNIL